MAGRPGDLPEEPAAASGWTGALTCTGSPSEQKKDSCYQFEFLVPLTDRNCVNWTGRELGKVQSEL